MTIKNKKYLAFPMALLIFFGSFFSSYQKTQAIAPAIPAVAMLIFGVLASDVVFEDTDFLDYVGREVISKASDGLKGFMNKAGDMMKTAKDTGTDYIEMGQEYVDEILTKGKTIMDDLKGLTYQTKPSNISLDSGGYGHLYTGLYSERQTLGAFSLGTSVEYFGHNFELRLYEENVIGYDKWVLYMDGQLINKSTSFDYNGNTISIVSTDFKVAVPRFGKPFFYFNMDGTGKSLQISSMYPEGIVSYGSSVQFTNYAPVEKTVSKPAGEYRQKAVPVPRNEKLKIPVADLGYTSKDVVGLEYDSSSKSITKSKTEADTGTETGTEAISKSWLGEKLEAIENALNSFLNAFVVPKNASIHLNKFNELGGVLKTVFPFSIPWDIIGAFDGLTEAPKAPKFVIDLRETPLIGGTVITLDFSKFEKWASISRWGTLIAFNIGLIVLTRKIIS